MQTRNLTPSFCWTPTHTLSLVHINTLCTACTHTCTHSQQTSPRCCPHVTSSWRLKSLRSSPRPAQTTTNFKTSNKRTSSCCKKKEGEIQNIQNAVMQESVRDIGEEFLMRKKNRCRKASVMSERRKTLCWCQKTFSLL